MDAVEIGRIEEEEGRRPELQYPRATMPRVLLGERRRSYGTHALQYHAGTVHARAAEEQRLGL
jgi:hypothetical protein